MANGDDEYQYVRLPDGTVGRYPKSVPDSEIADAIDRQFPPAKAGAAAIAGKTPSFWEALNKPLGQDVQTQVRQKVSDLASRLPERYREPAAYAGHLLTAIPASIAEAGRRMTTSPLGVATAGAGAEMQALRALPQVPRAVKAAATLAELGTGAAFGAGGAKEALTPRKEGETGLQEFERRVSGAGQALMGAAPVLHAIGGRAAVPERTTFPETPRVIPPEGRIGPGMRTRAARLPEPPPAGAPPAEPLPPAAPPTATEQFDAIAQRMFGTNYEDLPQEKKVAVVRNLGAGPGGVERRVTRGEAPGVTEQRAGNMPLPTRPPEPTAPGIARPGQPNAEPAPSGTLPRAGLPAAPPPVTLGGPRETPPTTETPPARPQGTTETLPTTKTAGAPVTAEPDALKTEFPDPKIRQLARANGPEIVRAAFAASKVEGIQIVGGPVPGQSRYRMTINGQPLEFVAPSGMSRTEIEQEGAYRAGPDLSHVIAVHKLTNVEIRQAAINAGIDVGDKHVGSKMNLGPGQISRQDLIDQMIRQGVKPEDIPAMSKPQTRVGLGELLKGETGTLNIGRLLGRAEKKPGPLKAMVSEAEGTQHTAEKLVRPNDGLPINPTLVLEKDGTTYYFGPKTKDQFKGLWEQRFTPQEIEEIRPWYEQLHKLFVERFGEGPQTPRRLLGFLVSQRNTPPVRGMQNVFRAEDVLAGFPKVHGMLGEDVINAMLQGRQSEGGLGPKLHDFVDSAYGRTTRTWMGDRPQGGQPAVIDVHSGRGTGYYDDTLIKFIRKNWGDEIANGLVRDLGSGKSGNPNPAQYERGSERYNKLADELNQDNYHNGGWTPLQVQAVDWTANGDQMGRNMDQPADIFTKNTQRIAFELKPSPDAPYSQMFAWDKLSPEQGAAITRDVTEATMKSVLKEAGGYRVHQIYGPGGYLTKINPGAVTEYMGSPEAVDRAMDLLGHLFQQDQVIASRAVNNGTGYAIEFREVGGQKLADPAIVQQFWDKVRANFPQAEGFNPVRDRSGAGMQILKYEGSWSDEEVAQAEQALIKAANEVGIKNGVVEHTEADVRWSNNDWKANPQGEERLNRLKTTGRPGVVRRIQQEYEPATLRAIRSAFRKYAPGAIVRK